MRRGARFDADSVIHIVFLYSASMMRNKVPAKRIDDGDEMQSS